MFLFPFLFVTYIFNFFSFLSMKNFFYLAFPCPPQFFFNLCCYSFSYDSDLVYMSINVTLTIIVNINIGQLDFYSLISTHFNNLLTLIKIRICASIIWKIYNITCLQMIQNVSECTAQNLPRKGSKNATQTGSQNMTQNEKHNMSQDEIANLCLTRYHEGTYLEIFFEGG